MQNKSSTLINILPQTPGLLSLSSAMLLGIWAVSMISQPIILWVFGEAALQSGLILTVLVQSVIVSLLTANTIGWRATLKCFAVVGVLAWFAEWVGSTSGFPFGAYHYTPLLQPQLAGVPLLIPLAWWMMLPPAWAITSRILNKPYPLDRWIFALVSAFAFTAWDLFLDPQMVRWGFWVWEVEGSYFGIPLSNYAGWLLVSFVISWIAYPLIINSGASFRTSNSIPLVFMYIAVWLLQSIGQAFFWGMPGPALFGLAGMGLMVGLAIWRTMHRETHG